MSAMLLNFPREGRGPTPWLVCLDLQREYVVPGRPRYDAANAEVVAACAQVLQMARRRKWRVVHSQVRGESPALSAREMFGAPIEGLRPLITEPVFSAFATPAFAEHLRAARGADLYLIGFSLADTCLATALAAVDEGLSPTLIEDAVGAGARGGAVEAARAILRPLLRIVPSSRLLARDLEVVS
jgi:nicotinamidase-related amidase